MQKFPLFLIIPIPSVIPFTLTVWVTYHTLKNLKFGCHACPMSGFLTCLSSCPTPPARFLSVISNLVLLQLISSCFIPFTLFMFQCPLMSVWVFQEVDATMGLELLEDMPVKDRGSWHRQKTFPTRVQIWHCERREWRKEWIGKASSYSAILEVLARPMVFGPK